MRSDPSGDQDGSPRRLWVEFVLPRPPGSEGRFFSYVGGIPPTHVGVTGFDETHCWKLVREAFPGARLPPVGAVVWDIDVSTLEPFGGPTGNPAAIGVWYIDGDFPPER
jgi:hypothetical protein